MNNLQDYSIVSLLPESLKQDSFLVALSEAAEKELKEAYREAETLSNFSEVENLPEFLLDYIAFQKHVDFYDNTFPIETKRALVKESINYHRIKGTPAAVEKVLSAVLGDVSLTEWFEYGGDPYNFKVNINVLTTGLSEETTNLVDRLIDSYKNRRSFVEIINLFLANKSKRYMNTTMISGEEIILRPWRQTEIETKVSHTFGITIQSGEALYVYPQ